MLQRAEFGSIPEIKAHLRIREYLSDVSYSINVQIASVTCELRQNALSNLKILYVDERQEPIAVALCLTIAKKIHLSLPIYV